LSAGFVRQGEREQGKTGDGDSADAFVDIRVHHQTVRNREAKPISEVMEKGSL
jgi:hypothetical protein